jgi:PAS domain-containing serine/threonine kinase
MSCSVFHMQEINRMYELTSDIVYRVRGMVLSCGRLVYCVWVSRDPEEMGEGGRYCGGNLTLTSSFNSTVDNSLGQVKLVLHSI